MPPSKFTGEIGKKLTFLYGNINGIRSKSEETKKWMEERKADIVALAETWADSSTADCVIADLDQYVLFRKDREGCPKDTGGGVAIAVKKGLQALRMTSLEVNGLEVMWIKLICLRLNVLIGVIYAPSYDADVFTKLRASMELIPPFLRRNIILIGDFNCPKIQWEGDSSGKSARDRDLILLKKEFRLWQKVRGSTRIRGKSSSSLDQLFVTQLGFVRNTSVIPPPSATCDHRAIESKLMLWTPNFKPKPKPVWKIEGEKISAFRTALSSIDWGTIFDLMCSVDVAVTVFQEKFIAAAKSAFQLKFVGAKRLHRPSLSEMAIESLRKCGSAYKKWRRTMDQADYSRWKELEASKRRIIQSDKHRRLRAIATSSRRNPRAVWKHIKKNTSSVPIPPIPIPGEEEKYIVHPQEKAEYISKEFAQVYVPCPQHCLPPMSAHGEPIRISSPKTPRCPPLHFTTPLILEQLRRLDSTKASGSFLITNRLLKIAGTSVLYPLSRLFELIVSRRQYPTAWKQAEVVPVPKKGSSQFRPISLLPPLSKLFEKIVGTHLTNYLNSQGLLSESQFGFRQRRSTEMQLLHMAHHYTQALLRREEVDAIFLDCSKAFDKLPHSTIVASLSSHGVEGELRDLLSDYLRGRSQRVVVDGHFSTERTVPSGVPQGSILGPTLFIIAVNTLAKKLLSYVMQYADDIVLWRPIKSGEDCLALQQDLERLEEWCKETGLEINPEKSQHLRISNKAKKVEIPDGSYMINSRPIPTESEAECLGVKISSKMEWTAHVDKVTAKCRQRLHAINGYFPKRYGAVKELLFNSLVRSVVDYASPCWFSTTKKLQKQLESIQKKFLQSIRLSPADKENHGHDPDYSRYHQHLREVQWKPLWHRRCENILGTAFKIWNGTFANGEQLMKIIKPGPNLRTRSQDKAMMLSPVSLAPSSRPLLESTLGSFAYIAEALLKDPLFSPSSLDLSSPGSFKMYVGKLHLSRFLWCRKYIDGILLV